MAIHILRATYLVLAHILFLRELFRKRKNTIEIYGLGGEKGF